MTALAPLSKWQMQENVQHLHYCCAGNVYKHEEALFADDQGNLSYAQPVFTDSWFAPLIPWGPSASERRQEFENTQSKNLESAIRKTTQSIKNHFEEMSRAGDDKTKLELYDRRVAEGGFYFIPNDQYAFMVIFTIVPWLIPIGLFLTCKWKLEEISRKFFRAAPLNLEGEPHNYPSLLDFAKNLETHSQCREKFHAEIAELRAAAIEHLNPFLPVRRRHS